MALDGYVPYEDYVGHLTIILLVVFLLFCIFTLVMLLIGPRSSLHIVTANIMAGHLLAGLLVHPGSIHLDLLDKPLTYGYCWVWSYLIWIYMCFVGYSMIAYSIERFLYMQNPVLHEARFSKKLALAGVVVLPWVVAGLFSVILLIDSERDVIEANRPQHWNRNQTMDECTQAMSYNQFHLVANFLLLLPVICNFTLGLTSLIIWCCYREHATAGTIYYSLGDEVRRAVRDSVIAVSVLNFLGIVFIIGSVISHNIMPMKSAILSVFGVIQGLVWLVTIGDTRDRLMYIGRTCCGLRKSGPRDEVHYQSDNNENVAIHEGDGAAL